MYELWLTAGRTRKVVARFRLLKDAEKYLLGHEAEGTLEIMPADRTSQPQSTRSGSPPSSGKPRRRSGVQGKAVQGAAEHPDEFIADQPGADQLERSDQLERAGNGTSD
jgi:hypothetical protein